MQCAFCNKDGDLGVGMVNGCDLPFCDDACHQSYLDLRCCNTCVFWDENDTAESKLCTASRRPEDNPIKTKADHGSKCLRWRKKDGK